MKYAWIDRNRRHWPLSVLCEQLEVSVSGYHQHWLRSSDKSDKKTIRRGISNDALLAHIRAIAEGYMDLETMTVVTHPVVAKNLLGQRLAELCCVLADRGFFSDPRNRVKYGNQLPRYSEEQKAGERNK